MSTNTASNFEILGEELLLRIREILPEWLPSGKVQGREYLVGNLRGDPGQSLSINLVTGKWQDFATGEKGTDLISLFAAIEQIGQGEAARALKADFSTRPKATPRVPKYIKESESDLFAPPETAPLPDLIHPDLGAPVSSWCYKSPQGDVLFYVARYADKLDPGAKHLRPWSWSGSEKKWVARGWQAPRPLYGLEHLATHEGLPVLIVEGEKAAEAARAFLGKHFVPITWPNGSTSFSKADWTPIFGRRVLLWPDADEAGVTAMSHIAQILYVNCPEIKLIDVVSNPDSFTSTKGFDAADALDWNWTAEEFQAWAAPRVAHYVPPAPLMPPQGPPTISVPDAIRASLEDSEFIVPMAMRSQPKKNPSDHSIVIADRIRDTVLFDETTHHWYRYDTIWKRITDGDAERFFLNLFDQNYGSYPIAWSNSLMALLKNRLGRSPLMNTRNFDRADTWSTDPNLIPLKNGVLDLGTRKLLPHAPDLMLNWCVPYDYVEGADCPTIRAFIKNLSQGDLAAEQLLVAYLWAVLQGGSSLQKYLELIGKPGTGKSTYLNIAKQLVGTENFAVTNLKQLNENRFETASFFGKRLVLVPDADAFYTGNASILKSITGEDELRFEEKLKQTGRNFVFRGMVIISANAPIQFKESSTALARRRLTVHIKHFLDPKLKDPELPSKITAEMPGLVNWLLSLNAQEQIDILSDARNENFDAHRQALIDTDPVAAWVDENLVYQKDAWTQIGSAVRGAGGSVQNLDEEQLYPRFVAFAEGAGIKAVSSMRFSDHVCELMTNAGFVGVMKRRHNVGIGIVGIRMRRWTDSDASPLTLSVPSK